LLDTRWTLEELEAFRQRLRERHDELRADIRRELRKYDQEQYGRLADSVADAGERSVADLLVDLDLAEISRDVGEVREIEGALTRIATGVYGICTDCQEPVETARLHYLPSAARCLRCQRRLEQRHVGREHRTL
jgi:DnaK suppressor protein